MVRLLDVESNFLRKQEVFAYYCPKIIPILALDDVIAQSVEKLQQFLKKTAF